MWRSPGRSAPTSSARSPLREELRLNAEIVGVGTELLLGQIANTNAQHISRELAAIGVDVYFHSVVGDNLNRVVSVLAAASDRADVVIVTGGLGPTPDDLTREAIATYVGRPLQRDARLAAAVAAVFERMGREMPPENLRQADLPEGAVTIDPEGTAPGFYLDTGSTTFVALPGVPWEMKAMLAKTVLPLLRSRGDGGVIVSREVLVIGLGESATHRRIADLVAAQSNPTIAYLAGGGQVRVRITAKASDEEGAQALVRPVEQEVRRRLGEAAVDRGSSVAEALGLMLLERAATVAAAESLTGGLIGATLTSVPGASSYFSGSLVCYSTEAKASVARVDPSLLRAAGVVSEETALALAEAATRAYGADLGLSATGVAGPDPQEGKPPGTVYVGATWKGESQARLVRGYGDRDNVRRLAVTAALDLGRRLVLRG